MRLALIVLFALAVGCRSATGPAKPPEIPADRYAKCSVKKSQSRPLIVEWPSTDRAHLESMSRRGLVAVRYAGCEMEILSGCHPKGTYKYTPVTLQGERITIRDDDELYAQIPVGAAKLEGELAKSGQLNVDTAIVGTYDSPVVGRGDLEGDCDRATHVLTSLTVGAFEFYSGASIDAGGGVGAFGVGAGAKTRSARTLLSRSGNAETCKAATTSDERPPEGCGALLRVEATPIAATRPAMTPEPSEPPPEATREPPSEPSPPAASTEPPPAPETSGSEMGAAPPPHDRDVVLGPGFLLGFRGPMGVHFGPLEDGTLLNHYAPVAAGGILEIGYRIAPEIALAANGTIFGGSAASSSDECPTGVKCKGTILGVGADAIVHPTGTERFWIAAGADLSWLFARASGDYEESGTTHTLETRRDFRAVGPHLLIGTDFMDSYVPQIQYGFMIGYALRKTIAASGNRTIDGVDQPVGDGDGITHTILFFGRFHFELGVRDLNQKSGT